MALKMKQMRRVGGLLQRDREARRGWGSGVRCFEGDNGDE